MNVADQYNSTIINFSCNCLKEGRKTLIMITGYSTNTELMNIYLHIFASPIYQYSEFDDICNAINFH